MRGAYKRLLDGVQRMCGRLQESARDLISCICAVYLLVCPRYLF